MRHYERGGIERPSRSPMMLAIQLSDQERADLVSFLETLTGTTQTMRGNR
jgi:cytochrome c peroxidase